MQASSCYMTNAYHLQGHPSSNFFISSADSLWSGNPPFNGAAELSTSKHKEASKSNPEFLLPLAVRKFQIVDDKSEKCSKLNRVKKGWPTIPQGLLPTWRSLGQGAGSEQPVPWRSKLKSCHKKCYVCYFDLFYDYMICHKHPHSKDLRGTSASNLEAGISLSFVSHILWCLTNCLPLSLSQTLSSDCQCRALL